MTLKTTSAWSQQLSSYAPNLCWRALQSSLVLQSPSCYYYYYYYYCMIVIDHNPCYHVKIVIAFTCHFTYLLLL